MPEENSQLKKLLYERLKDLPQELRDEILDFDMEEKIRVVVNRNGLPESDFFLLENESVLLVLGVRTPDEFEREIARKAGLESVVLQKIVRDINELVFNPLLEAVEKSGKNKMENYRSILKNLN